MHSSVKPVVTLDTAGRKEQLPEENVMSRRLKLTEKIIGYLKHYCNHTTLHGFSYLVDPDLGLAARCFWFVVMTTSCCLMIVTVNNQILNFINNPIVMAHNGRTLKMNDIPFPALSFCSDNQIKPSDMNLTKLFSKRGNYTATERHFLSVALSLCYINKDTINYDEIRTKSDVQPLMLLIAISNSCKSNIREFKWHNKILKNPCKYLNASITIDGGCYSFNQVHAFSSRLLDSYHFKFKKFYRHNHLISNPGSIWMPEKGYITNRTDLFPWRMQGGSLSRTVGFILDLDANDMQDFCTLGGRGYLVKGYNPAEQPTLAGGIAYAQVDRMTIIEVVPELITTSDNLMSWSPQKRGCYYDNERSLSFYSLYTYNNCEMECVVNITMDRCNCSTSFLPHLGSHRSCNIADMECVKRLYYSGSTNNTSSDLKTQYSACNCLPSCVELKYNFKVNDMPWNFSSLEAKFNKKSSFVGLHITYKGGSVNVIERDCVYTFSSLIASIGGVMGLFMGFSTISFFEIIYYTIIKWLKLILRSRGSRRIRPVLEVK